jgi:SOS-response transcriptional repressor LexA
MTLRQKRIVEFIDAFWEENWTSPNVRQIGEAVGLTSKSSTHRQLMSLVQEGVLERKEVDRYKILYRRRKISFTPTSVRISPLRS